MIGLGRSLHDEARSVLLATALALASAVAGEPAARAQDDPTATSPNVQVAPDPSGCLGAPTLREQVRVWLKRERWPSETALHVQPGPRPHEAEFALHHGTQVVGRRRFDRLPEDCTQRAAALGLAMAVAVDESVLTTLQVVPPPAPAASPAPPRADLWLAAGGGVQYGMLPRWGPLGSVGIGWNSHRNPWGFQASIGGTARGRIALGTGSIDTAAVFGTLEGCGLWRRPVHALSLCAGALVGVQLAHGERYSEPLRTRLPWIAAQVSAEARFWRGHPAGLWIRATGHVQVLARDLQVQDLAGETLATTGLPPAGASGIVGVWFRLR